MIDLQSYIDQVASGNMLAIFKGIIALILITLFVASIRNAFSGKYLKWTLTASQCIVLTILLKLPASVYEDLYMNVFY